MRIWAVWLLCAASLAQIALSTCQAQRDSTAIRIRNLRDHPYEFYQKIGFVIVGVMPDANGWDTSDIYLAKRA